MPGSLTRWCDRHDGLRALALEVWCALPEGEAAYEAAVTDLVVDLQEHLALEEEHLLPAWAALPDPPPNATADVYRADHVLLRRHLATLSTATSLVDRATTTAALVEVLDHHDRRERSAMFPGLDRTLPAARVAAFLAIATAAERPRSAPRTLGRRGPRTGDPAITFATDAPLDGLLGEVRPPNHPKGERLLRAVQEAVASAEAAPSVRERRARLLEAWGRWRLLGLVSRGDRAER
jgi:hypothetical protein